MSRPPIEPHPNPLVAPVENEDSEPLTSLEGAGVFSSFADVIGAGVKGDPAQLVATSVGLQVDMIGFAMDPLGSLGSAGVGWLIEHVWFLHEPLDALAGDPTQIKAYAQTWHNIGIELTQVAGDYARAEAEIPNWAGPARDGYGSAVTVTGKALADTGKAAEGISQLLLYTGAAIGTVRASIRDIIADWIVKLIEAAIVVLSTAPVTGGAGLAAFVAHVVTSAVTMAKSFVKHVSELMDDLVGAADSGKLFAVNAQGLSEAVLKFRQDAAGRMAAGVAETGKQITKAAGEPANWSATPAT